MVQEDEVWVWVPGFGQAYEISSRGRVRSWLATRGGRRTEPRVLKQVYHVVLTLQTPGAPRGPSGRRPGVSIQVRKLMEQVGFPVPEHLALLDRAEIRSPAEKEAAVLYAIEHGFGAAGERYGVSSNAVRDWGRALGINVVSAKRRVAAERRRAAADLRGTTKLLTSYPVQQPPQSTVWFHGIRRIK